MINKALLKEWRVWLLALAILWSLISINPLASRGVVVTSVANDSPLKGIVLAGDEINSINEMQITVPEDLYLFENFTGVLRIFHNGELDLADSRGGGLGLEVRKGGSNINLGLELVGGTRALLSPIDKKGQEVVDETIATLQTRMNIYGLRQMEFQSVKDVEGNYYVQVEVSGAGKKEIEDLLARQGSFKAYITRVFSFVNGSFSFLNKSFSHTEKGFFINGDKIVVNDTFSSGNITYHIWNYTNSSAVLAAEIFDGEDIRFVYTDPQRATLQPIGGSWEFNFGILVSDESSKRFAEVTKDIPLDTGGQYLTESIHLFIDEIPVSCLRISADLKGDDLTAPSISGGESTRKDAEKEMRRLQSILKSGSLPSRLETLKIDTVSPSLGQGFVYSIYVAGFLALALVSLIIFFHYRELKLVPLVMMTAMAEMLITLGIAASLRGIWTIDLARIAGILGAI